MHGTLRALVDLLTPSTIDVLVTLLVGVLTAPLFQVIKRLWLAVDRLPAWAKPVLVLVTSFLLTHGAALAGIQLSTDQVGHLTSADVSAILSAILAMLLHQTRRALKNVKAGDLTDDAP